MSQPANSASATLAILFAVLLLIAAVTLGLLHDAQHERHLRERAAYQAQLASDEQKAADERWFKQTNGLTTDQIIASFKGTNTVSDEQPKTEQWVTVMGILRPGLRLYSKDYHLLFGYVVKIESGYVWVADSYQMSDPGTLSVYARRYERSLITENCVTKVIP